MNTKTDSKSQCFRNCKLQILRGDHSLATQDGGDCVVDVFEDTNNSLVIRIRSGELFVITTRLCITTNSYV